MSRWSSLVRSLRIAAPRSPLRPLRIGLEQERRGTAQRYAIQFIRHLSNEETTAIVNRAPGDNHSIALACSDKVRGITTSLVLQEVEASQNSGSEETGATAINPDPSPGNRDLGPDHTVGARRYSASLADGTLVYDQRKVTKDEFRTKLNAVNHFWYQSNPDNTAGSGLPWKTQKTQCAIHVLFLYDSEPSKYLGIVISNDVRPNVDVREFFNYRLHLTETTSGLSFLRSESLGRGRGLPGSRAWGAGKDGRVFRNAILRGYLGKLDEHGRLDKETATIYHPLKSEWLSVERSAYPSAELGLERDPTLEDLTDTSAGLNSSRTAFSACISDGPLTWSVCCKDQEDFKKKLELVNRFWQDSKSLKVFKNLPDPQHIGIEVGHIRANALHLVVYNTVLWSRDGGETRKWLPCRIHISLSELGWSYSHATFSRRGFAKKRQASRNLAYEGMRQALSYHIGIVNEHGQLMGTSPSVHPLLEDYSRQRQLTETEAAILPPDPVKQPKEEEVEPPQSKANQNDELQSELQETDGEAMIASTDGDMPFSASIVDGPLVWCERTKTLEDFKTRLEIVNKFWQKSKSLDPFKAISNPQGAGLRLHIVAGIFSVIFYKTIPSCQRSVRCSLHSSQVDGKQCYSHFKFLGEPTFTKTYRWTRRVLISSFESAFRQHIGSIDEQGHLEETSPVVYPMLGQWLSDHKKRATEQPELRQAASNTIKQDNRKGRGLVGLQAEEQDEKQSELQNRGENERNSTFYERIAATMRLARGVHEINALLGEELDSISPRTGSNAEQAAKNFLTLRPVQDAIKGTEIDVERVRTSIQSLKARLNRREDGTSTLAFLLKKWRRELHEQFPLTKSENTATTEDSGVTTKPSPTSRSTETEKQGSQDITEITVNPDEPRRKVRSGVSSHDKDTSSSTPSSNIPQRKMQAVSAEPQPTADTTSPDFKPRARKSNVRSIPSSSRKTRPESVHGRRAHFENRPVGRVSKSSSKYRVRGGPSKGPDDDDDDDGFSPFAL